jgi:hypothetical protein
MNVSIKQKKKKLNKAHLHLFTLAAVPSSYTVGEISINAMSSAKTGGMHNFIGN